MKTILLPTDFEKHSDTALEFAIEIAKKLNARIIVAHSFFIATMDANVPANLLQEMYEEEKDYSEKELIRYCQEITKHKGENGHYLQSEFITEQNPASLEISNLVKEKKADCKSSAQSGQKLVKS